MASLKCNYCGFNMRYSDPCGIEYKLVSMDIWQEYLHQDIPLYDIVMKTPNTSNTIWQCPVCTALHWLNNRKSRVEQLYVPMDLAALEKAKTNPSQIEKYVILVDKILELLCDEDTTLQQYEESTDYPIQLHAIVSDRHLVVFNDSKFTQPVRYYARK